ncbi:MAG TPA: OmpH family outer membrane protein [Blastocatellia bacterium]|nr:OmpH family outer membrane protein [Blastocatellia bacterium]
MKRLMLVLAIGSLLSLAGFAQTPTPPARTAPAGAAAAAPASGGGGGIGAEGKVAYINTAQFRQGINELKAKLDTLNTEFDPKKKEIQSLEEELNNLKNKIQTQGSTVSPQVRTQWVDEATEKEKGLKRRAEDYDALIQKRLAEVTQPVYEKVGKYLEQYCQQRSIVMVIEGGAAQQQGVLIFASPTTDITDDFMKEYNKANPAAGGTGSKKG